MNSEWERTEQREREEALLREIDEKMPPMTDEFAHTLDGLSRLASFIHEDVDNALRADSGEVRERLEEIARKADILSSWLRRKAEEYQREA